MELLLYYGTASGKKLHAFILDAYDDQMAEDSVTVEEFIAVCTAVFNEHEPQCDECGREGCPKCACIDEVCPGPGKEGE